MNWFTQLRSVIIQLMVLCLMGGLSLSCGELDDLPFDPCADKGSLNCPCEAEQYCDRLPDRTQLICEAGQCVMPACQPNGQNPTGCVCQSSSDCEGELICSNGTCSEDRGQPLELPDSLECYSRCRGGELALEDGTVLLCNDQGLIPGCPRENTECINGACVNIAEERQMIEATLKMVDGDKAQAAALLGITQRTIYRKEAEWKTDK